MGIQTNLDNCGCAICLADAAVAGVPVPVSLEKTFVPDVPAGPVETRAPRGLGKLKKLVAEYFGNPSAFLDMTSLAPRSGRWYSGQFIVMGQSFEQVTGLEKLGSGHYSDVYALDETRVLKVVKQGDSGYARYVSLIRGSKNPYFPRILYSGIWGGKQIYILERLSSGPATLDYRAADHFREALRGSDNPFLRVTDNDLAEAAKIINDNNLCNDFHSDNLMWRGDVPVISDPCSEGY